MNAAHTLSRRLLASLFAASMIAALAGTAAAQECASDADCGEGFACEYYPQTCAAAPGEDPVCDTAPPTGECVRAPQRCDTDADCGQPYLGCYHARGGDGDVPVDSGDAEFCAPDPEGNGCAGDPVEDPQPIDEQGYCGYREITCEANSDCPADFECTVVAQSGGGCAEPAIAPACDPDDANCDDSFRPDPTCDEEPEIIDYKACTPREIECGADSDCPTDWTCVSETWGYCEGSDGGGSTDEGGAGAPPPDEDGDALVAPNNDSPGECFEETISRCLPPGLENGWGVLSADDSGEGAGQNTDEESDRVFDGSDDEDGGSARNSCSVATPGGSLGGLPLLLLLAASAGAFFVLRRR